MKYISNIPPPPTVTEPVEVSKGELTRGYPCLSPTDFFFYKLFISRA